MSVLAEQDFIPARELPNGKNFYSDLGIFGFQADGFAEAYAMTDRESFGGCLPVWDTGIGKTVLGLLLAAYMFEDGEIDQVMVICERNKVGDWHKAFERFTSLSVLRYHGQGRQKRLERHGVPHAIVTTYETGRDELMARARKPGQRGRGSAVDGPLVTALRLRGKRILWIFDEPIKMKSRSSGIYQAYWYVLGALRKLAHQRVVGLTATPMDTDYEQAYNIARMVAPKSQPNVGEFEKMCISGHDPYGNPVWNGRQKVWAQLNFQPLIIRKRKTDLDVIDQFPKMVEESQFVAMHSDHAEFYRTVQTMLDPPDGEDDPRDDDQIVNDELRLRTLLRMTAGHPAAHLHVGNELSKAIVEIVTPEGLRAIPSSKTIQLLSDLRTLVRGQGDQVIVFEYYKSVIIEVARELRAAGYRVGEYHGGIGGGERERTLAAFKAGQFDVLLASDAGARGLNIQEARYVTEYSSSETYSNRVQRGNRNNRIDSKLPSTTLTTMVLEGTLEERIFANTIDRNEALDTLVGDEEDGTGFVSADTRRATLDAYHERRNRKTRRTAA